MVFNMGDFEIGEYSFLLEYNISKDISPIIVWVYDKNGDAIYQKDSDKQVRRIFDDKDTLKHIKNFCMKLANDEKYRQQYIDGLI